MTTGAPAGGHPVTATAGGRTLAPSFTAVLRIPSDPAAADHRWPDQWPHRSALELAALDTAPGCARAHARAVLREWSTPADAANDGLTVVSELVTNAVTSTRKHRNPAPVRLWLLGDGTSVLILVWDATMPPPEPAPTAVPGDTEHGRGLTLVAAMSARWGWYYPADPPGGKVVWALIPPPGPFAGGPVT